jgi:CheY-like chemotaxis protein
MARILVAEDDPAQAELRRWVLERAGHEVHVATNSRAAVSLLGGVDLLLLDLCFPDLADGLALIRTVHGMPIVILSGWPDDLYGRPEEALVSAILIKPVPVPELLRTIASAQSKSSSR